MKNDKTIFPDLEEIDELSNNHKERKIATKSRRRSFWPRITIDLNSRKHRRYLFFSLLCVFFICLALPVTAYEGYAYTESSEFCGTICHPMAPQFARYKRSLHTNVACTECHVGRGAAYYLRSKIDGTRQLYQLITNTYSRPIKSPVHNLRPARETCEECHTPESFKDNIVKKMVHYDNDEANTPIVTTFILKMGGWQEQTGMSQGIHWHISNPVYYIAADEQRQIMLWVGVQQKDGSLREFYSRDMIQMAQSSFVDKARIAGEVRKLDCIDCHNRAAHEIPPPETLVDEAISSGLINPGLPFIRVKSVEVLKEKYLSSEEAKASILGLADYYHQSVPEISGNHAQEIATAISTLQNIYSSTSFPDMNLNWATNPNNQNHTYSAGCFRCHDDKHVRVDDAGKENGSISASCNLCHTVPIVGKGDDLLVESPVIVGAAPASHADFSWTIQHRNVPEAEKQDCLQCHGQAFCNNSVCHSLSHPPDMLFKHADEYRKQGDQVCYTCHQDISCTRCHPGGVVENP